MGEGGREGTQQSAVGRAAPTPHSLVIRHFCSSLLAGQVERLSWGGALSKSQSMTTRVLNSRTSKRPSTARERLRISGRTGEEPIRPPLLGPDLPLQLLLTQRAVGGGTSSSRAISASEPDGGALGDHSSATSHKLKGGGICFCMVGASHWQKGHCQTPWRPR